MMDFVAIDFETANSRRESACSIGLAKFNGSELIDTYYSLLKPPVPYDYFEPFNVSIHGITAKDVGNSPTLGETWGDISEFIGDLPVVAHNAGFDLSVLRRQLDHEGVKFGPIQFTCTLVLSKHMLDLPVLKLPYVVESLGLEFGSHHNALDDAIGAGQIFAALIDRAGGQAELFTEAKVRWGVAETGRYVGSQHQSTSKSGIFVHHTNEEIQQIRDERKLGPIDPESPLYGKVVAFTLELKTLPRKDARLLVELEGGTWVESPNKATDFLVIGDMDLRKLKPGATLTNKMQKGFDLKSKGGSIEILDESSFLELLSSTSA